MNSDQLEGNWKQLTGALKEKWGQLTGDDTTAMAGVRERLEGSMQERYGYGKEPGHGELKLAGLGRWKALNAKVDSAFEDLRAMLEDNPEYRILSHSRSQAVRRES